MPRSVPTSAPVTPCPKCGLAGDYHMEDCGQPKPSNCVACGRHPGDHEYVGGAPVSAADASRERPTMVCVAVMVEAMLVRLRPVSTMTVIHESDNAMSAPATSPLRHSDGAETAAVFRPWGPRDDLARVDAAANAVQDVAIRCLDPRGRAAVACVAGYLAARLEGSIPDKAAVYAAVQSEADRLDGFRRDDRDRAETRSVISRLSASLPPAYHARHELTISGHHTVMMSGTPEAVAAHLARIPAGRPTTRRQPTERGVYPGGLDPRADYGTARASLKQLKAMLQPETLREKTVEQKCRREYEAGRNTVFAFLHEVKQITGFLPLRALEAAASALRPAQLSVAARD